MCVPALAVTRMGGLAAADRNLVGGVLRDHAVLVKRHVHPAVHLRQEERAAEVVVHARQHVEVVGDVGPPAGQADLLAPDEFEQLVRPRGHVLKGEAPVLARARLDAAEPDQDVRQSAQVLVEDDAGDGRLCAGEGQQRLGQEDRRGERVAGEVGPDGLRAGLAARDVARAGVPVGVRVY